MAQRKLDDHKLIIAAEKKALNKEIEKIPTRIDEASRKAFNLEGKDENALKAELVKQRQSWNPLKRN